MLSLIGLGLVDGDITLRGLDAMRACEVLYCELYTNRWMGDLKRLEAQVGKPIKVLTREEVESDFLLEQAREKRVGFLVSGDPLAATTHFELVFQAKQEGIPIEVLHAPSIYTAVAGTGLQLYKFGRATTLVLPEKDYLPASPLDVIMRNRSMGLHTLVLLDIREGQRVMTVAEAIDVLLRLGRERSDAGMTPDVNIIACCRVGMPDMVIKYGTASQLKADASLAGTPAVLIVPGELNFKETEALRLWM